MVLPEGFALPPLPYLAAVAVAVVTVAWLLARESPPVDDLTILAFGPWMALGSALYVCFQLRLYPESVAPFFGSPIVYATTFAVAGATWLAARRTTRPLAVLAGVGAALALVPAAAAINFGLEHDSLDLAWPLAAVVAAAVLGHVTWFAVRSWRPEAARLTGVAGALAVFGHVLDGTSTAVGIDVLGFGEQTPLSALVMEFAAHLPTEPYLGVGWLFVLVKVALVAVVVVLLADYVREVPGEGYLLLGLVAAVGLGPGVHNVLLFVASNPTGF
ncbi:hypothetical protein HALDL1_14310 [Halobacterium sp. DL1]|jgi:uncharacterized membrane protein|nr:hypothetical protein HALDL1_14310 [Halobacterium sp. DL1]